MSPVIKDREGNILLENERGMKAREGFDKDTNSKDIKYQGKDTHTHTKTQTHLSAQLNYQHCPQQLTREKKQKEYDTSKKRS